MQYIHFVIRDSRWLHACWKSADTATWTRSRHRSAICQHFFLIGFFANPTSQHIAVLEHNLTDIHPWTHSVDRIRCIESCIKCLLFPYCMRAACRCQAQAAHWFDRRPQLVGSIRPTLTPLLAAPPLVHRTDRTATGPSTADHVQPRPGRQHRAPFHHRC